MKRYLTILALCGSVQAGGLSSDLTPAEKRLLREAQKACAIREQAAREAHKVAYANALARHQAQYGNSSQSWKPVIEQAARERHAEPVVEQKANKGGSVQARGPHRCDSKAVDGFGCKHLTPYEELQENFGIYKYVAPSTSEYSATDATKIDEQQAKVEELERRMKSRQQELEEKAEALQRQINAQNSVTFAPRGVQVSSPGRVIHY